MNTRRWNGCLMCFWESESLPWIESCKGLQKVIFEAKKGYTVCGQCCHVGGWQRESRTYFVFCFCFFLPKGMFSEQKRPEKKLTQGGRKICKRQPQSLYMNSRNLNRTNDFLECRETCKLITLEALSKG